MKEKKEKNFIVREAHPLRSLPFFLISILFIPFLIVFIKSIYYRDHINLSEFLIFCTLFFSCGIALAILFSIPKTPDNTGLNGRDGHQINTSIQDISDWITKIIIGIGLTQVTYIKQFFSELNQYAGPLIYKLSNFYEMASILALLFFITGILMGFLLGRVLLSPIIAQADRRTLDDLTERVESVQQTLEESKRESEDRQAQSGLLLLELERYLDRKHHIEADIKRIAERFTSAGNAAQISCFMETRKARSDNLAKLNSALSALHDQNQYQNQRDSTERKRLQKSLEEAFDAIARCEEIFQIMVDEPSFQAKHEARAQLAYCQKDKRTPDNLMAKRNLELAVEGFIAIGLSPTPLHKLNLALLNILIDNAERNGIAASPEARKETEDFIEMAATAYSGFLLEDVVLEWLSKNSE